MPEEATAILYLTLMFFDARSALDPVTFSYRLNKETWFLQVLELSVDIVNAGSQASYFLLFPVLKFKLTDCSQNISIEQKATSEISIFSSTI